MTTKVAVIGAGSWGTTVAALLAPRVATTLWARRPEVAVDINTGVGNRRYLDGFTLPAPLTATDQLAEALDGVDLVIMGVPTQGFRTVLAEAAPLLPASVPVISLAKGFEQTTHQRMTQIITEVLPGHPTGVLTGPNLAKEILAGQSAATVVACTDSAVAAVLQDLLTSDTFRVYTNQDLVGCEIGGAVKNVIALAAGMAEGLGTGDNARAALITRGLAELTRLGEALGGDPRTLSGLAGLGDTLVTCMSPQSRNRTVGERVGRGETPAEVLASMTQVAEGARAAGAVCALADEAGIEVPIAQGVRAVFDQGQKPAEVWATLMTRQARPEVD